MTQVGARDRRVVQVGFIERISFLSRRQRQIRGRAFRAWDELAAQFDFAPRASIAAAFANQAVYVTVA